MDRYKMLMQLVVLPAMLLVFTPAHAQEGERITSPDELRELLSGKEMDGEYWVFYFRPDGKMAYLQDDFVSVRERTIKDNGDLCLNVYSMPDRIIDCLTIHRVDNQPGQYQISGKTGLFKITLKEPSDRLVNAVMERAGPE